MSETNIIGKPLSPSIRVSSTDPHKITTPVARPVRGGSDVAGSPRAPHAGHGGQPAKSGTADVTVGKRPTIEHTTSSSSSKQVVIPQPSKRTGTRPQREGLPGTLPAVEGGKIPAPQAALIDDLLRSYAFGLSDDNVGARELAMAAAKTIDALK